MKNETFFETLMRPRYWLSANGMRVYKTLLNSEHPLSVLEVAEAAKSPERTTRRNIGILRRWGYVTLARKVLRDGVCIRLYAMATDPPKEKPVLRGSYAYRRVRTHLRARAATLNPFDETYGKMADKLGLSLSAIRVAVAQLDREGVLRTELQFVVDRLTGQQTKQPMHTRFWFLALPFIGPGAAIPPPPPRAERPAHAAPWRQGDEYDAAGTCCRECGRPF